MPKKKQKRSTLSRGLELSTIVEDGIPYMCLKSIASSQAADHVMLLSDINQIQSLAEEIHGLAEKLKIVQERQREKEVLSTQILEPPPPKIDALSANPAVVVSFKDDSEDVLAAYVEKRQELAALHDEYCVKAAMQEKEQYEPPLH